MSSENASRGGGQAGESAPGGSRGSAERAQALAVAAMDQPGRAGALQPGGGARAGALAAMEAAGI